MGWFRGDRVLDAARTVNAGEQLLPTPRQAAYTVDVGDITGLLGGTTSRDSAMLVPAFARGHDLICGVGSGLPLSEYDMAGNPIQPYGFTATPTYELGIPRVTTIRTTISDLVCDGEAFWVIVAKNGYGYPQEVFRVEPWTVSEDPSGGWTINGNHYPADWVIHFDLGTPGALESGWYTLRTAQALEMAALNYANAPMPGMALRSTGMDLDPEDALGLVTAWEAARRKRSTAYLNSQVETVEFGWNSRELQLVEARQHAAVEVARILNLDPTWVGASAGGSSLTYRNQQELNQSLLDATILPLLRVIEQRLSMLTVGRQFRFDTAAFLRADLAARVAAYTAYIAAGVMTVEEARDLEPLIKEGPAPE